MRRSIGCVIGLALLASCGIGGSGSSPQGSGSVSSSPPSTPGAADPLVGTWRQDYTCEEQVGTFMRTIHHSTPAQLRGLADLRELPSAAPPVVIAEFAPEFAWGPNADTPTARTAAALCKGAPDRSKQMLVQGGYLAFYVPDPLLRGVVAGELAATYHLVNDHTFTANDGDVDLGGTETFSFRIEGDRLTIKQVGQDAWAGTAFEMAPFVRTS